jgi:LemA protein
MKIGVIILIIIVLLAVWFGSTFVGHRNEMVRKREAINSAWAQVDVVLQRRADLIPNLVETVKGYAGQEQKVFGDIAAARAALVQHRRTKPGGPGLTPWVAHNCLPLAIVGSRQT